MNYVEILKYQFPLGFVLLKPIAGQCSTFIPPENIKTDIF